MKLLRVKQNKILWCPVGPVNYILLPLPNRICNRPLHLCTYIILVHPTRPHSSQTLPGDTFEDIVSSALLRENQPAAESRFEFWRQAQNLVTTTDNRKTEHSEDGNVCAAWHEPA